MILKAKVFVGFNSWVCGLEFRGVGLIGPAKGTSS